MALPTGAGTGPPNRGSMMQRDAKASIWSPAILFFVLSATLIEVVLQLADAGLLGSTRLRIVIYQNTAFWPGLLSGWIPNYAVQPYAMFLTYAFVHGGLTHLILNMVTLVSLGVAVIRDAGQIGFLLVYLVSTLAGALVFAITATSFQPMVGASGALFGLAGALVWWNIRYTFRQDTTIAVKAASVLWPATILTLLNVLMYYGFDKNVAWQTHLGGFVGGVAVALFFRDPEDGEFSD